MFKKTTLATLVAAGLLFGATACGDDESSDTAAAESDAGDTGASSSDNADVRAYCDQAEQVADELKQVMADPTSGDMAALSQEATELVSAAAQLVSANADDVDEINRCSALLTEAVGG